MKNQKKIVAIIMIAFFSIFYGCEKTEPDVATTDRDKFIGTWIAQSLGAGGPRNFTLKITASNSAPDQVLMNNFDGGGTNTFVPANINGNTLSIIRTVVSGETIEGSGAYSGGNLSFTFTIDDGQTIENRTGTAHK